MKKVKAIILAVMLVMLTIVDSVLSLTNITVEAANSFQISVDTIEAKKSDKGVQVAVNIENPNKMNIGAIMLEITWDKTALKATNAVAGEFMISEEPQINTTRMSEGFIAYADASAIGKNTEGQMILMTFDVLDEAKEGLNSINVKVLSAASAVPEGDNQAPIISDITEINGGIKLPNTSIQDSLKVSVDTVDARQGQTDIQVAVNIENPDKMNIGAIVLEITWDKTALKATNAVVGEFVMSQQPELNTTRMSEGFIGYADASAIGKTTEGQIILMTFDVLDEAKGGLNSINVKVLSAASAVPEGDNQAPIISDITEVNGGINVACMHVNVKDSDYKITKEPTVTEEGIEEATCPDCGTKLSRAVDKLVCTHANVKDSDYKITKEPTVTEEGIEEATCPDCGTKLSRVVDKLICTHINVKDSDYKITKAPTYTEEGIEEATCPDCGTKLSRVVDKLVCTHANVKDGDYKITKEPTVTEEGIEEAICPDCGIKLTRLINKVKYGDINADGLINIQDGVILKKHLAGIKGLKINLAASDVKADNDINIQDAIILLKHLAGMDVTLGK